MKNKNNVRTYILLHVILLLYSFVSVLSKKASTEKFMSIQFWLLYGGMLIALMVYALLWQQILKKLMLTIAFANKAIVIIWGIVWGKVFFMENISWNMIVGAILIILGIVMVGFDAQ